MLIDTHCHLHDRDFFEADQAIKMLGNARKNAVERVICIGTSHDDSLWARKFAHENSGVYWTYGVHPELANNGPEVAEATALRNDTLVAIGEVGLDYHYEGYSREKQIRLFERMLQLAIDLDLPLSFHVREAFDDFLAVVGNFPAVRGVVHSFSDSKKSLKKILEQTNFLVGVNGLATYSTLPTPPLERIVLETDAPFLTPVPFRGIINEPAYIRNIAEWLAAKLDLDYSVVEKETTKNAERLFRF